MNPPLITSPFVKSSYSTANANDCVEVAHTTDGGRAIRDSKRREGGISCCSRAAWAAFLRGVAAGALDR
jgi:hypothetical protein